MNTESKIRNCPLCKEEIKVDAIKCKYCGSPVAPEKPAHEGTCPYCKEQIHPEAIKCKHCKSDLRSQGSSEGGFGGDPGADLMPTPVSAAPGIGTGSAFDLSAQGVPGTPGSLPEPALPLAARVSPYMRPPPIHRPPIGVGGGALFPSPYFCWWDSCCWGKFRIICRPPGSSNCWLECDGALGICQYCYPRRY